MLNNNNSPIAGVNSFKNNFQAPAGSLILETTLQPGDWIGGNIGSSTGYVRVHFWDTDDMILGDGTPYSLNDNNNLNFSKKTSENDIYVDRSFAVYSCDSNGNPSGDILSVSLTDLKYANVDFSPLVNLENLHLDGMYQTSLNLTENVSLKRLYIYNVPLMTSLDLAGLTGLKYLRLNITGSIYNIGDLSSLIEARISSITSESIDFTTSSLEELWMNNCYALNSINVAGLSNLIKIDLENIAEITSIDLTGLTGLQSINIRNMNMANLDLTGLTSLNYLYFNSMSYLDPGDINDILGYLDANGVSNGYFYDGQISRSTLSNASFNSLIGKGWTLQIPTTPIEVPGTILTMPTILQPNDSIDGSVGSSTGYIKVSYWDGTYDIIGNGTSFTSNNNSVFSFSKTVSSDDSYLNKTIIAYSCDSHGYPSGNILSVDLNNAKYGAIDFSSLDKLQYLRLVNNSNIASLDLTACSDLYYFNVNSLSSLISVDLSGLTNLVSISSENNSLLSAIGLTGSSILARSQSEIDLGRATENSLLFISNNTSLNSIDLTGFGSLDSFNITNAPISILNSPLTYIRLFTISLTTLPSVNLSNYLNIERAIIVDNRSLISIDLTNSCSGEGTGRTNINDNPLLESIFLEGCGLKNFGIYDNAKIDPYDIDSILAAWDSKGRTNGNFYGGNIQRTTLSNANYANLISKGWSLQMSSTPMLPAGAALTIPTTLAPGDTIQFSGISVGTETGYIKVSYWDGTSQILGNGTVYNVDNTNGIINIDQKTVASNDAYTNRSIVISGCTSTGSLSGDLLYLKWGGWIQFDVDITKVKTNTIDITGLTKLQVLYFNDGTKTNSVNFSTMTNLRYLYIDGGNSMNISGLNLFTLEIKNNNTFTSISGTSNMKSLDIQSNSILTSVNVSASTNMEFLRLQSCPITTITGMNLLTKLNWLSLAFLPIASIDLTGAIALDRFEVSSCVNITLPSSMNLASMTNLTYLYLDNCKIPSFEVKHLTKLITLTLRNSITIPFDFTNYINPVLKNVTLWQNTNWTYSDIDYMIQMLTYAPKFGYFTTNLQRSDAITWNYNYLLNTSKWTFQMPSVLFTATTDGVLTIPMNMSANETLTLAANSIGSDAGFYKIYFYAADGTTSISVTNSGVKRDASLEYTWTLPSTYVGTSIVVKIQTCNSLAQNTGAIITLNLVCDRVTSSFSVTNLKFLSRITLSKAYMISSLNFSYRHISNVIIDTEFTNTSGVKQATNLTSLTFPAGQKNGNIISIKGADLLTSFSLSTAGVDWSGFTQIYFVNDASITSLDFSKAIEAGVVRIENCPIPATQMDSILNQINTTSTYTGGKTFYTDRPRTAASNAAYNSLVSKGWTFTPAMTVV